MFNQAQRHAASEARARDVSDPSWNLHDASYFGRVDVVKHLLDRGADPNQHHDPSSNSWTCGPTPLSKAITAWSVTDAHVEIVALLIRHGARVDDGHMSDFAADAVGSELDQRISALLEQNLASPREKR